MQEIRICHDSLRHTVSFDCVSPQTVVTHKEPAFKDSRSLARRVHHLNLLAGDDIAEKAHRSDKIYGKLRSILVIFYRECGVRMVLLSLRQACGQLVVLRRIGEGRELLGRVELDRVLGRIGCTGHFCVVSRSKDKLQLACYCIDCLQVMTRDLRLPLAANAASLPFAYQESIDPNT